MTTATGALKPPRRIAVNGRPIRLRWLQQIIWSFLAANVGALIISALYYLIIQVRWHVGSHTYLYLKPDWGFPWQPVVIGILAGLVVHRVYAPAGNTVQLYFIGRSVDRTRDAIAAGEQNPGQHLPHWPWPPLIRERAAWIMQNNLPVPDRTRDIRCLISATGLTSLSRSRAQWRYQTGGGRLRAG